MIDPMLSLALSVYSNPGVYAVLLGSGVSRSAGIPTGWEVVLDLIRKVAHLQGKDCEPDPAGWYKATFGEDPDYAKLLEKLAQTPAERSQLLRDYFEPADDEEREHGLKMPTPAHQAIARMASSGDIRVILTTNFDRLMEKALDEVGITPTVISTPEAIAGAIPLTHTRCTIIKMHGDYLDARIKNTPDELARYPKPLNHLLDRVLDEFGLVVSGWSAGWDTALRAAIERAPSHRFSTFWTTRGPLGDLAQKLVDLRRAQVLSITDADAFFRELDEKVTSLRDLNAPHPLSARVATATIKRYLVDEKDRIRLHDLVFNASRDICAEIFGTRFPVNVPFPGTGIDHRVREYESLVDITRAMLITGCYWGKDYHDDVWVKSLEMVAEQNEGRIGVSEWLNLRLYPALHLLYAAGIAAVAAGRYRTLAAVLTGTTVRHLNEDTPLLLTLERVLSKSLWALLPGMVGKFTPLSEHLYEVLREPLREILPLDLRYEQTFDRFEYLLALVYADLLNQREGHVLGPIGRFGWKAQHDSNTIVSILASEVAAKGSKWPPLRAGLFGQSLDRFLEVKAAIDQMVGRLNWW